MRTLPQQKPGSSRLVSSLPTPSRLDIKKYYFLARSRLSDILWKQIPDIQCGRIQDIRHLHSLLIKTDVERNPFFSLHIKLPHSSIFQQQDVYGRIQDHPAGYKKVKIIIWPDRKKFQIIRPDIWCLSRPVFRIRVILSGSGSDFFSWVRIRISQKIRIRSGKSRFGSPKNAQKLQGHQKKMLYHIFHNPFWSGSSKT